jgi:imidazolonepropionase-like amidohydrolase
LILRIRDAALALLALAAAGERAGAGEPIIGRAIGGRGDPAAWGAPNDGRAGQPGGPGLALRCAKALTCARSGPQFIDEAVVLVRDGKIEAITPAPEAKVPEGYERLDLGAHWLMPGMVDLHYHSAGSFDINDMVYLANPELRVAASVVPRNPNLDRNVAGGVTTVLYIPGSGTNIGGQGVLLKTGLDRFEEMVVRNPGSLKVAQWGNPERWVMGVGKTFEAYTIRDTFSRGRAYAQAWKDFEQGRGPQPELDLMFEPFRPIFDHKMQVSVHTQIYQVVLLTCTMLKGEFGVDVFLDHSEIGGWMVAPVAEKMGVAAIIGPRSVDPPSRFFINWAEVREEGFIGLGAGWQKGGHTKIGFNTDAPVIPGEELLVQATMAGHYGMDGSKLDLVRGLTIVPAMTAGLGDRLGSLEPGKDADLLLIRGDPVDPRNSVERVWIEGRSVYDVRGERRRF